MLHRKFNKVNNYVIHLEGHVHPMTMVGTLVYDEETSPLLQPSPRSKKVYVADLSNDLHGVCMDYLTHGLVYEIGNSDIADNKYRVWCDNGGYRWFSCNYFKEVYLYDEDETLLTCRDIKFKEGDYLDLRKHTPEQIRHIGVYWKFFDIEDLLNGGYYHTIYWDGEEFVGDNYHSTNEAKEYSYDDIFYLEDN